MMIYIPIDHEGIIGFNCCLTNETYFFQLVEKLPRQAIAFLSAKHIGLLIIRELNCA